MFVVHVSTELQHDWFASPQVVPKHVSWMESCDGGGAADEKARRKAKRTKTLLQVAMIYIM